MPPISPDRQKAITLVSALADKLKEVELLRAELAAVLGGHPGIGDKLSECESTFGALWKLEYGTDYVWSRLKDRAQWKRLLLTLSVEELGARSASFMANKEPFYVKQRHSFGTFVATVNSHAGIPNAAKESEADATARYLREMRK